MDIFYAILAFVFPFVWVLGALTFPDVGEVECLKRLIYGRGGTITAATNASPSVLTFDSTNGPPPAGSLIIIAGATGNTAINTTAIVYNISGNTASIATVNASTGATTAVNGNGTFGGTCVWSLASVEGLTLKLMKANTTLAETDTAGTYTEAAFTGYAAIALVSKSATTAWTTPASGSPTNAWSAESNVAEATYVAQTFSATSSETEYGYYYVGTVTGILYAAEKFASSIALVNPSTLSLTPRLGAA